MVKSKMALIMVPPNQTSPRKASSSPPELRNVRPRFYGSSALFSALRDAIKGGITQVFVQPSSPHLKICRILLIKSWSGLEVGPLLLLAGPSLGLALLGVVPAVGLVGAAGAAGATPPNLV